MNDSLSMPHCRDPEAIRPSGEVGEYRAAEVSGSLPFTPQCWLPDCLAGSAVMDIPFSRARGHLGRFQPFSRGTGSCPRVPAH